MAATALPHTPPKSLSVASQGLEPDPGSVELYDSGKGGLDTEWGLITSFASTS
jgi:hypothetical protein